MKERILSTNINNFSHALVEAGHFYGNETLTPLHEMGIKVGQAAVNALNEIGLHVTPCVLVDDYNAPDLYSKDNLDKITRMGFTPGIIYYEKDVTEGALELLSILSNLGKTKSKKSATYLKEGFKLLQKPDGTLSCALLDSALYIQKHARYGGVCVTVLPGTYEYKTQQQTVHSILKSAGMEIPVMNIFFSSEGDIETEFKYKMKKYYKCIKCLQVFPFNDGVSNCPDHNPYYGYLTLMYDYKNIKFPKSTAQTGWSKYRELLPCREFKVNFNEQITPVIKLNNLGKKLGLTNLYLKDESKNPTGSFKDKESICAINMALEWGINRIFVVSSGNAAVSTAAYAQKAGIECYCIISKNLSPGKRALISLYGGKTVEMEGSYELLYQWAIDTKYPGWNCTPGINPVKEDGIKIIGFEIFEEIGVPDLIITPCGNGTLLYGIYKSFKELQFMGLIDTLPVMIGVQIKNASPLKSAFENSSDYEIIKNVPDSLAEGIIAEQSYSSPKVMHALMDTGGQIIEIDEEELLSSLTEITSLECIIPEPTSSVVFAAVKKIQFERDKKIVLIQTAGGFKNLKEIMESQIKLKLKAT